jgi:magnesium chelatase family protein
MFGKAFGATPRGVEALFVTVEVDRIRSQMPATIVVGLPDAAVREARERVFAAIRHLGKRRSEPANTVINLAPADEKKEGANLDLPIAAALLAAYGELSIEALADRILIGELSLEGRLQAVRGVLPIVLAARARGSREVIIPADNAEEGAVVSGVRVVAASTLGEVVRHLRQERPLSALTRGKVCEPAPDGRLDLSDVIGQEQARRALEVAAAGGHHLLMIGPPGSGKSMLAQRLSGILPPMTSEEALESTCVYSVSTRVPRPAGLLRSRPFRAPHHTISSAALIGGGSLPQPGEASLAHHGVLFLDELTEYRRDVLEGLRQPLEDRRVTIARARSTLSFPASFQLIAAANPCPCGHLGDIRRECTCAQSAIYRYRSRLSGPLLDRIDLQMMVPAVAWKDLSSSRRGESSQVVAQRIRQARQRQQERLQGTGARCNGDMGPELIDRWAQPKNDGKRLLERAARSLGLSARAYHRILRVARTIADLAGEERIQAAHLSEAVAYRGLDRQAAARQGRQRAP